MRPIAAMGIAGLCMTVLALALAPAASAQDPYPNRPIRIIVGYTPGGIADTLARLLGDTLSRRLAVAVVVENRTGAGGLVGAEACARAAPDGYTMCIGAAPVHSVHAHLQNPRLDWNPRTAFAPVTLVATEPVILAANPSIPAKTPEEFVDWLRRNPDAAFATGGAGTTSHLLGEALSRHLGLNLRHIPYRGSQQSIMAAITGEVPMVIGVGGGMLPFLRDGKLAGIGVSDTQPSPLLPGVKPLSQTILPTVRFANYQGLFMPAATAPAVIERIATALTEAFAEAGERERIAKLGLDPVFNAPDAFSAWLRESDGDWKTLVDLSGLRRQD